MIKKVTVKWLEGWDACNSEKVKGIEWFKKQKTDNPIKLIELLIEEENWKWIYYSFGNILTKEELVDWAIYSAEQVLPIFEKEYPNDKRPRKAIESAKNWLKNSSKENQDDASAAAAYASDAARADADAGRAAAADAAVYTASDAAAAAYYAALAARAARATYYAAAAAAYYAALAARAADDAASDAATDKNKMRKKCVLYVLNKLKKQ